ncbi:hypothetical protein EDD18DRAFT_1123378 [Armillaria luteobubalina]|uniref:Uncharacterized protein n=1 Tax=Armillaria luteobubalina TaxID=153913 RepID=A0AA39UWK1_9AGAR|nr:hypothetical protein EDD18DRAFT_1123378 [Armillaria luteobubalina]
MARSIAECRDRSQLPAHWPLPDERPRQSVANLIGRFEQQTKRQSISASPARSSSVVSQSTGDSAKEEVKEKRDWPPRAATSYTTSPSSSWIKPQSSALKPSSSTPISTAVDAPVADTVPSAPSSFKSSPKALTPKISLGRSTSTPLKPQHTGQSTTSTTSSARKTVPRTSTTTAARTKTPSPKTPSSSVRPGSGLFAPTAASLARARDAQAPAPVPKKKSVLSSAVADRLNKPTAASASKARAPAVVPSRGKPVTRGVVKPKLPMSGSTRVVKKDGLKGAAVGAVAAAAAAVEGEVVDEHAETNGHATEPPAEQAHEDAAGSHEEVHQETEIHTEPEARVETEREEDHDEAVPVDTPEPTSPGEGSPGELTPVAETHSHEHPVEREHDSPAEETRPSVGSDIEDIVNLLELTSRPVSIVSIPDEVVDIPDESE